MNNNKTECPLCHQKITDNKQPTSEQIKALQRFSQLYGRTWKTCLRQAWMTGNFMYMEIDGDHSLLRQLREPFGYQWLEHFEIPTEA